MSEPVFALRAIRMLVEIIVGQTEVERLQTYAAIRALTDDLSKRNLDDFQSAYMSEKLSTLGWHCAALAKLNDGNGHPDHQHQAWARREIESLASQLGFDVPLQAGP